MIRLIVIALIIYLIYMIFKRWAANKKNRSQQQTLENDMVKCEVCQLHVPENEALQHDGKYYCSQKHLDKTKEQ